MPCLKAEEVGDRFRLILNERQCGHSTTGRGNENATFTCANAGEAVEVHQG